MAKKLFEVEPSGSIYVMAEDADEAADTARHECEKSDITWDAHEVAPMMVDGKPLIAIYAEWEKAIPYGGDDDKTVGEIVAEMRARIKEAEAVKAAERFNAEHQTKLTDFTETANG